MTATGNKPKILVVRFDKTNHNKLIYMGIETPSKNCDKCDKKEECNPYSPDCEYGMIMERIYGKWEAIAEIIPDEEK